MSGVKNGYGVRMRDTSASQGWGTYVQQGRESVGLSKTAMATALGKNRLTVKRWEDNESIPEDYGTITAVAALFGDDESIALAAAGYAVDRSPPPPADEPAIELINSSSLPAEIKLDLIDEVRTQSAEDADRRRRYVERLLQGRGR